MPIYLELKAFWVICSRKKNGSKGRFGSRLNISLRTERFKLSKQFSVTHLTKQRVGINTAPAPSWTQPKIQQNFPTGNIRFGLEQNLESREQPSLRLLQGLCLQLKFCLWVSDGRESPRWITQQREIPKAEKQKGSKRTKNGSKSSKKRFQKQRKKGSKSRKKKLQKQQTKVPKAAQSSSRLTK